MGSDTSPDDEWYAIIDTAQDPQLYPLLARSRTRACLFSGALDLQMAAASPHLVRLRPEEPLLETWKTTGRGQNWGIMFRSPHSLADMRKQFRKLLHAMLPDGTIALFRFYDPRVFNTYIRAAVPDELKLWFEYVALYAVESDDPDVLHNYHLRDGRLFDADRQVAQSVPA